MDDTLNRIPCGYLSLLNDNRISAINQTILDLLGYEHNVLNGRPIDYILSSPSRIFFRIYFTSLIMLNTQVDEMFLILKSSSGKEIPVLLNAVRQEFDGNIRYRCVIFPIHRQMEYEQQITRSETAANKARHQVQYIHAELENEKQSLLKLESQIEAYKQQIGDFKLKLN